MSYGSKAAERIAGKTVLITGASSGIGQATALELASAANGNLRLILAARREDRLNELKKQLESQWPQIKVHPAKLDLTQFKSIPSWVEQLPSEFAAVDVLVNNAGMVFGREKVGSIDLDDISVMYHTNVLGLIALTNTFMEKFRARSAGDVVMIGSIAGQDAYPGGSIYCSTKSAIRAFTKALRKESVDTGVRIIEVDPGMVETEFSVVRFRGNTEEASKVYQNTEPLLPADIAEVIAFALTRKANTVVADVTVYPSCQGGYAEVYRKQ